jgi:hypothetical protein
MHLNRLFAFALFSLIVNCKNYYNDTIHWADNLNNRLDIESVKNKQPSYIEIDWKNPRLIDNEKWYLITKIRGNNDPLGMSHYLVFSNNKYLYRESKK